MSADLKDFDQRLAASRARVDNMPRGFVIKPAPHIINEEPHLIETRADLENLRNYIKSTRPPFSKKREDPALTIALLSFIPSHIFGLSALLTFGFIVVLAPWWYTAVGLTSFIIYCWAMDGDKSPLAANIRFKWRKRRLLRLIDDKLIFSLEWRENFSAHILDFVKFSDAAKESEELILYVTGKKVVISCDMYLPLMDR